MEHLYNWKNILINGEKSNYQICDFERGIIRNVSTGKLLKRNIPTKNKYIKITLHHNGKKCWESMHHLIGLYFIPNPENKPTINHKNGIRWDNRKDNLEWATMSEQQIHAYKYLDKGSKIPHPKGKDCKKSKPILQIHPISKLIVKEWINAKEASIGLNIYAATITNCLRGRIRTYNGYIWAYKHTYDEMQETINKSSHNHFFTYNGETKRIFEWAKHFNIKYSLLRSRLIDLKMSFEIAISRPVFSGRLKGEPRKGNLK